MRTAQAAWGFAEAIRERNWGAALDRAQALQRHWGMTAKPCFAAGVPVRLREGFKRIEEVREGDEVLSRPENDLFGEVSVRRVAEVFVSVSPVRELSVNSVVIKVTVEHPFWVRGKGWLPVAFIEAGDELSTHRGEWVRVEGMEDRGEVVSVYNFRVEEYSTYFVGCDDWGFDVWTHNLTVRSCCWSFPRMGFVHNLTE